MGSSRETTVALGRFSLTQDSPVVPAWTATWVEGVLSEDTSDETACEMSAEVTSPWLESM